MDPNEPKSDETRLSEEAVAFVKQNKKLLIDKFGSSLYYPSVERPVSFFMAGSPGAGKTEFSKRLIEKFKNEGWPGVMRIDPDDIRELLPGYNGSNSYLFQGAVSIGVEKLVDYAFEKKKLFLLDGTFSNWKKCLQNVERSLKYGRLVTVVYLYQDPLIAWEFTKRREIVEHRHVPKESFVEQFFAANRNVKKIKEMFKEVQIWYIEMDPENHYQDIKMAVEDIDAFVKISYSEEELLRKLT